MLGLNSTTRYLFLWAIVNPFGLWVAVGQSVFFAVAPQTLTVDHRTA